MRNWHSVAREPPLSADSSSLSFTNVHSLLSVDCYGAALLFLATTAHYEGDRLAPSGGVELYIDAIASSVRVTVNAVALFCFINMKKRMMNVEEESVYLHIGNGGVVISAGKDDAGYLVLSIRVHHFNQQTNHIQINTSAKGLKEIGQMLIAVSEKKYREGEIKADLVSKEPNVECSGSFSGSTE